MEYGKEWDNVEDPTKFNWRLALLSILIKFRMEVMSAKHDKAVRYNIFDRVTEQTKLKLSALAPEVVDSILMMFNQELMQLTNQWPDKSGDQRFPVRGASGGYSPEYTYHRFGTWSGEYGKYNMALMCFIIKQLEKCIYETCKCSYIGTTNVCCFRYDKFTCGTVRSD